MNDILASIELLEECGVLPPDGAWKDRGLIDKKKAKVRDRMVVPVQT